MKSFIQDDKAIMSERPRYLTDEESACNAEGEGFGLKILTSVTTVEQKVGRGNNSGSPRNSGSVEGEIERGNDVEPNLEIIRLETEGYMIFQYPTNNSPEEPSE
jgi:hypothetical protein